jgi:hypothetical protein
MFENRVLRGIFGPKREEDMESWTRLHNEELHNSCASSNIIIVIRSRMGWGGYRACIGQTTNAYKILVGKPERKRPLGTPRYRRKLGK